MKLTRRRLLWLVIMLALLLAYVPINRFISGGWALSLPVDKHIPLFPPAIIPYLFGTLLFVAFPVWAALYIEKGEFEAYAISLMTAAVISSIIYLALPTFIVRPEIQSHDIFSRLIVVLYHNDFPYCAAPSGHTFYTTISLLYFWHWQPRARVIALIIAVLIIASTLFTRQHYVLDLVAGLALAFISFRISRRAQKKCRLEFAS
jgi:membrane-associated phospholipid phosphatase